MVILLIFCCVAVTLRPMICNPHESARVTSPLRWLVGFPLWCPGRRFHCCRRRLPALAGFSFPHFGKVRHPDGIVIFAVLEENAFDFRIFVAHIIPLFVKQTYCRIAAKCCNFDAIMQYAVKISCDELCIKCK